MITRAPSKNELDNKSGVLSFYSEKEKSDQIYDVVGMTKESKNPTQTKPKIVKLWVYDQEINSGTYLQGTYLFLQIDKGHWVNPMGQEQ